MKNKLVVLCLFICILTITSCKTQQQSTEEPVERQTLTVMTHDSFAVSAELISTFETINNVQVQFIKGGDTGAALNRVILLQLKGAPPADVFYGIDNTFLSRALENDIFEPYASPLLDQVPMRLRLDPENRALPIDYGDVCINYDKAWFSERKLNIPASFEDLLKLEYKGLLVVENPATSSPGLAFLLATIAHFGEDGWQAYWQALVENEVVVTSDWESAYYTQFSGSSGRGPQPMVVSYASSPAAELIYAETDIEESPTASIISAGTCFRQIEFAGILKGTENRLLAEKFIDFMLSKDFQADVPLQMFVFPVVQDIALPEAFQQAVEIPAAPAILDPALIAANRETWIKTWTEIVLQ